MAFDPASHFLECITQICRPNAQGRVTLHRAESSIWECNMEIDSDQQGRERADAARCGVMVAMSAFSWVGSHRHPGLAWGAAPLHFYDMARLGKSIQSSAASITHIRMYPRVRTALPDGCLLRRWRRSSGAPCRPAHDIDSLRTDVIFASADRSALGRATIHAPAQTTSSAASHPGSPDVIGEARRGDEADYRRPGAYLALMGSGFWPCATALLHPRATTIEEFAHV